MTSVYVASPYGFSAATHGFYADLLAQLRAEGFEPLDPWAEDDPFAGVSTPHQFAEVNSRLAAANVERIERCDAVLAFLDGTDVDSGVAAEIGYAAARGKRVVGVRLDFRVAGDNPGSVVNLQVEHFCTAVCRSVEAALVILRRDANRPQ